MAKITVEQADRLFQQALPIGLFQSSMEVPEFAKLIANVIRPRHIMEIGTYTGGTLYLMHLAALAGGASIGVRMSVDLAWPDRGHPEWEQAESNFKTALPSLIEIIGNSHDPDTLRRVKGALWRAGKPANSDTFLDMQISLQPWEPVKLDLLFIDADHTYEGTKSDFEEYSPLVTRCNGYVAFHDVSNGWSCGDYVRNELFPKHEHWLIEGPVDHVCGIGVIKL